MRATDNVRDPFPLTGGSTVPRKASKTTPVVPAILITLALILAACGGGSNTANSGSGGSEAPETTAASTTGTTTGTTTTGSEEGSGYPLTITDAVGREVTLDEKPERIVSMAPSATETLFAVGAGTRVVGVTTSDDYPKEVEAIEEAGDYEGPNVEKVLSLETDLLVFSTDGLTKEYADDMQEKTRAEVVVLNPKTVDEAIDSVGMVAEVVGEEEKGQVVEERLDDDLKRIQDMVADEPKPTVFYEVWGDPLQTAGPGSFVDDAIRLAGGENVAADTKEAYPQYSKETLLQKDPDYYLVGETNGVAAREIESRPGYSALSAVKEERVLVVNDDLVVRPGPRIVEGVREIAEKIHPEAVE
jgi:iron complex transport system substrate-binding protein